ncbi:MAG TPA: hypothetical protein VMH39_07210 [Gemmatimonadaceae bacterium]|nr:hypothetical protein [Gemmatimonadaceae bacterium]
MPPVPQQHVAKPTPSVVAPNWISKDRPRFEAFTFTRTPSGQCSAEVVLELDGRRGSGRATGASSPLGDLRISAEACIRALDDLMASGRRFELVGVKHVRAFDANLAVVSISQLVAGVQGKPESRLVGCYLAEHDVCRAVAIAVLNATNRVIESPPGWPENPS